MAGINQLIINSAYREPTTHWKYDIVTKSFHQESGRRPAGYVVAGAQRNDYNDQGEFKLLPLVNRIRPRVKAWREAGYPGITGVTKRLLEHWHDKEARQYPFFFCQLDAIETIIWLTEAPDADKVGIDIPGDGGDFHRICTKMCTGSGKTTVMAMLIAWHVCNKVAYPQDTRFSKNILIVAPGITVKNRLKVLQFGGQNNYYVLFSIVPSSMLQDLRQGRILIIHWRELSWDTDEELAKKKSVDKRGALSDEAYTRKILGEMKNARNILVINDEAHHAWRKNPEVKISLKGQDKKDYVQNEEQATVWISGLDRINKTRNIMTCYDFSATPFAPSGKKNDEGALFGWIVSDFGLNDGIESGLVKTPRIVVRDDAAPMKIGRNNFRSKLYHIYADPEVKDDINRDADESEPLPDLLMQAYALLGKDWQATYNEWKESGMPTPPVMITVANSTKTAARIKYAFEKERINVPELCIPEYTVRIDSKVLKDAENGSSTKKAIAQAIRDKVDTVGQRGKPGEQVRNVISVGMLSEGWDAKTVTHIMGLRAFSSQLLCEQVVGRGLRRTSYDLQEGTDMFAPEYVNIFGIPFRFLPTEDDKTGKPKPPKPKTQIESRLDRAEYCISWPNIVRLERVWKSQLHLDIKDVPVLDIDAEDTRIRADLAPVVDGNTDLTKCTEIDLEKLDKHLRLQSLVFKAAGQIFDSTTASWKESGTKYALLGQLIHLIEKFLRSSHSVQIHPSLFYSDDLKRRIIFALNMNKIVQHISDYIRASQTSSLVPVYDTNRRVRSTADMPTWFTSKPTEVTTKSQISHVVCDSGWEYTEAYKLEKNPHVVAYAKNDHLGFKILYTYKGVIHNYIPDFLIKLDNGTTLVLEVKGQMNSQAEAKRKALDEWIKAVYNGPMNSDQN